MNQPVTEKIRWTTADLELLPEGDRRYEIVDGELLVTSPLLPDFTYPVTRLFE